MPSALLPGSLPLTLLSDPVLPAVVDIIPDTELTVVVTDKDGNTTTLDSHASDPGYRPRGIACGSQQGSGFYTGGFNVSWPIDREHPALHLRDKVQFVGANGEVAYEGFITDLPRSTDSEGRGTLSVQLAGYMADTSRQSFRMPFIDRELSPWGEVSIEQRIDLIAAGWNTDGGNLTIAPDATGAPGMVSTRQGVLNKPINRFVYDAGPGVNIARLYVGTQTLVVLGSGDANLEVFALFWSGDNGEDQVATGDVKTVSSIDADISDTPRRYAVMDWRYNNTAGGTAGVDYGVRWQNVWVIGDHGLSTNDVSGVPQGVTASDVIRYLIGTYCPKLNTAGVQDHNYPIGHLAFRERTKVYDALLKVNSFALWQIAVWENGTVHYGPADLTKADWTIRHDEVGNQIGLQGDSVEQLRNGIIVSFTNVATGAKEELHPDDHPELRDDDPENPWNAHGDKAYGDPFEIPFPVTQANALELGRIRLLEDNQVKAPGAFTVGPWIRDSSGMLRSVSEVRAGQTIQLVSSATLSDRPRLIVETSYNHDSRTATIAVDSTLRLLDGFVDRALNALTAAGLQT